MATTGKIIAARRRTLGLSQAKLGERVGVRDRQVRRWEADEATPELDTAVLLADVLGVELSTLAGLVPMIADLNGDWCAAWQTSRGGVPVVDRHRLRAVQVANSVTLDAEGDYHWRGDFRIVETSLLGTYQAVSKGQRSWGTMHFEISPYGDAAVGRWTGSYADGPLGSGWGALSRDEPGAARLLADAMERNAPPCAWFDPEEC